MHDILRWVLPWLNSEREIIKFFPDSVPANRTLVPSAKSNAFTVSMKTYGVVPVARNKDINTED